MNFEEIEKQIINVLEKTKVCVFASANRKGEVSAVQMTLVNDGLKVFVQTDKNFEKVKNIKENPNVAINIGAFSFKGIAKIIGRPTDNKVFVERLKNKSLETYNHYTNLPNEVLIEVELTQCKIWGIDGTKSIDEQETILVCDLKNKTIQTVICDKM